VKVVFSLAIRKRFWLGMMMRVSTCFCSSSSPPSACASGAALELEGLGHDADGQDAHLARRPRDDRGSTRAGAAAHAGGDEAHVAADEAVDDLLDRLLRRRGADLGPGAGAEALGHPGAELELVAGPALLQRLVVGVGDDELAALELVLDHVVDGVAAGAADADHRDPGVRSFATGMLSVSAMFARLFSELPLVAPEPSPWWSVRFEG
jgi:hypothetical protein